MGRGPSGSGPCQYSGPRLSFSNSYHTSAEVGGHRPRTAEHPDLADLSLMATSCSTLRSTTPSKLRPPSGRGDPIRIDVEDTINRICAPRRPSVSLSGRSAGRVIPSTHPTPLGDRACLALGFDSPPSRPRRPTAIGPSSESATLRSRWSAERPRALHQPTFPRAASRRLIVSSATGTGPNTSAWRRVSAT
jgi:hypothetical protein